MFEKRKDNSPEEPSTNESDGNRSELLPVGSFNTRSAAMIGATIKIKGNVTGAENLVIEGKVDGSVELADHDLTIGQTGEVVANITAKTVIIEGQITGDVTGSEKVILTKSGRVNGNIVAPRVTLEDGAKFKGSIDMDTGTDKPAIAVPPKRPSTTAKSETVDEKHAQTSV